MGTGSGISSVAAWIALFALDVAAFHPFASVGDYFLTIGGSRF